MNSFQKRFVMFMFGCMIVRSFLVYLAKTIDKQYLPYLGYLALLPAIGMGIIYLFGLRKTGAEVLGDKIWWNNLRPVHSLLYFTFAFMAIQKNNYSWIILLIDLLIGFTGFTYFHYTAGDFSLLFAK